MKRLTLSILTILIAISVIGVGTARAAPSSDDIRWLLISKLRGYNEALDNNSRGQYGLYYSLFYLTKTLRWTEFLLDKEKVHGLNFSDEEANSYAKNALDKISAFSEKYGKKLSDDLEEIDIYFYFNLDLGKPNNIATSDEVLARLLSSTIPTYLEARVSDINKKYLEAKTEGSPESVISENKDSLRFIYQILTTLASEEDGMSGSSPTERVSVTTSSKARELLSLGSPYFELLSKAKELNDKEVATLDNVAVKDTGEYLERLAFVKKKDSASLITTDKGSDLWINDSNNPSEGFELRDVYIRMIAASAVYRPFISNVGDREFIEAFGGMFTEDDRPKAINLYEQIRDYRKPLSIITGPDIKRHLSEESSKGQRLNFTGEASIVTLDQFLKHIEEQSHFGLVTSRGLMAQNKEDGNTFSFFNDNPIVHKEPNPEETSEKLNPVMQRVTEKSSSSNWTSPVFSSGYTGQFGDFAGKAGMMNVILWNYMKDIPDIESLSSNTSFLFINALGDIVTQDNRIIVPAAMNIFLFKSDALYNPYTVAFMKGYPNVVFSGTKMTLRNNKDKQLLFVRDDGANFFLKIQGQNNFQLSRPWYVNKMETKMAMPMSGIDTAFKEVSKDAMFTDSFWDTLAKIPGWYVGSAGLSGNLNGKFLQKESVMVDDANLFDYDPKDDLNFKSAKAIARNFYMMIKGGEESVQVDSKGTLDHDYVFNNVLLEGLNGTIYVAAFYKSMVESYDFMKEEMFDGIKKTIAGWAEETTERFGDTDRVLGIKNPYQDKFFGAALNYIYEFFYYIAAVVAVLYIIAYLRSRASLKFTVSMGVLTFVLLFVFLRVIPMYMPVVYNFILNPINSKLSHDILIAKSEKYDKTYGGNRTLTEEGKFKTSTTSIDLYKFTDEDLDNAITELGITRDDITSGNIFILDSNSGTYLDGNSLKANVDILLYTNPIIGRYDDSTSGNIYQFKSSKQYSSVIDYYTPYYLIEDGLVDSINKLLQVFTIPKVSIQYTNGLYKDGFAFSSYVDSPPFLTPGEYDSPDLALDPKIVDKLYYIFDNPDSKSNSFDFLNLDRILSDPTSEMVDSLWYRTMIQNDMLPITETGEENYWGMIEAVNTKTKKFMIKLRAEVGYASDENLIKITSLYATSVFNRMISDLGNQVYPQSLNYQEYLLNDVLMSVLSKDYRKFMTSEMDIANYVVADSGAMAGLFLMAVVVLARVIVEMISLGLPALYILYVIMFMARFIYNKKVTTISKGYLKISLLLVGCITLFVAMLGLAEKWSTVWALISLTMTYSLILYVLFVILFSMLFNFTEMGNSALDNHAASVANKVKSLTDRSTISSAVNNIKSNTVSIFRQGSDVRGTYGSNDLDYYKLDSKIDSYVGHRGSPVGRQAEGRVRGSMNPRRVISRRDSLDNLSEYKISRQEDTRRELFYDEDEWKDGRK